MLKRIRMNEIDVPDWREPVGGDDTCLIRCHALFVKEKKL